MTKRFAVLHVVGGVGPGNPYGGPVSVALDQAAELRGRGHHVEVVAPWLGAGRPAEVPVGATAFRSFRAVPMIGFSGIVSPSMSWWIARNVRRFDVVHVHLARDLTTTPAALTAALCGVPFVLQTHGMVDPSSRRSAAVLDAIAVRRVLGRAGKVLCLTDEESAAVAEVAGRTAVDRVILPNGLSVPDSVTDPPTRPTVVFAARLAQRKRPDLFVAAARKLLDGGLDARFVVAGPDEGFGQHVRVAVEAVGRADHLAYLGALDRAEVAQVIEGAGVLVVPSANEPFPVSVLEALAAARPVIVTESCGLAPFVVEHRCGVVVPPDDVVALASAIESVVRGRDRAAAMGRRG
ncbi:MAG: hypothetical protein RLZZ01_498, partial [Actinomycetota bacterium]